MLYSFILFNHKLKLKKRKNKDNSLSFVLFWEENNIVRFLSVSVLYVFMSVLSTCSPKAMRVDPFLLDSSGQARCLFCGFMDTYVNVIKKSLTKKQKLKKKEEKKWFSMSRFCFYRDEKNTDNEQWSGQRIKSLFFILYICKSRFQYLALLCCTNQMCLWHFSNLIYFTVCCWFSASPLKFKGCTQRNCVSAPLDTFSVSVLFLKFKQKHLISHTEPSIHAKTQDYFYG